GMAAGGDLLVPRVAGLRWLIDPPLYHWVAAALGKLLQWAMEFHAGARLASGLFVAAALYFIHAAGREWADEGRARVAGAAEALPELASLAAIAAALACLPHAQRRPARTGAWLGAALGLAFLGAGWIAPV